MTEHTNLAPVSGPVEKSGAELALTVAFSVAAGKVLPYEDFTHCDFYGGLLYCTVSSREYEVHINVTEVQ